MTLSNSLKTNAQTAQQLNQHCHCRTFDKIALQNLLRQQFDLYAMLIEQRPYLFADTAVFVAERTLQQQYQLIAAIEKVVALPSYQQQVLAYAPRAANFLPKACGVFLGYDFHLTATGSQLIEINTNAGGSLLNTLLLRANGNSDAQRIETAIVEMFLAEWQKERGLQPLMTVAIVDEQPENQFLLPEFLLFQQLFQRHHINAIICDPSQLSYRDHALWHHNQRIDLVYNRLTDFGLDEPEQQTLCDAYLNNAVVVTPHPRAHALYADKRNLVLLTDSTLLKTLGVDEATIDILVTGIAHTVFVQAEQAEALWVKRKQLFFKPTKGYGSKAVYRGDKLTKRVFDEILTNDYVAQTFVPPSERHYHAASLKFDVRHYAYQDQILLTSGRLYQGQTTNFRTEGGGFAEVVKVADSGTVCCI
jgi:hypothetical protein